MHFVKRRSNGPSNIGYHFRKKGFKNDKKSGKNKKSASKFLKIRKIQIICAIEFGIFMCASMSDHKIQ